MPSRLKTYYQALAETNLTAREQNIPVRGVVNLQTSVSAGDLPVRLLLPVGARADGRNIAAIDLSGRFRTARWRITDLLLLANTTEGRGLEDFAEELVDYVVQYETVMNARRQMAAGMLLEDLSIETGIFEWPHLSGVWYFGAQAVHGVKETIE